MPAAASGAAGAPPVDPTLGAAGSAASGGTGGGGTASGGMSNLDPNAAGAAGVGNQPGIGGQPGVDDPGSVGDFVSLDVEGGASAAFVCPSGVTFGNPLEGMGTVQSVSAPTPSFFVFIEGPVWVGSLNLLFFSDNASGPERIWQLSPPFTTPSIFLEQSGSNGLALDNDDQLLLADQGNDRVTRVDPTNAQIIDDVLPTGNYNPNDLILRTDDNLYFTDPDRGFYRVSPAGELSGPFTQANAPNGPNAPNGIVLSPDENTLYVGDVQQNFVTAFELLPDGAVDTQSGQVFVNTVGTTLDGMAFDCAGNLYVGTNDGVEVYSPTATPLGTVPTGLASNATFGGVDRRTLFVTSGSVLRFVTLGVPGLPN